jgi:MoaA/NifB/PqqE/SkfB family radical SAM enzyme
MASNFALLQKHVESDIRRQQLLNIERRLREHPYPPQLVIENTSICNLTCIHCSHRELKRTRRHMKRELWNKIVEEFGANSPDTEIWPTFYGEALIMGYKSELWDRLDYAAAVGCRNLVLNSNGTLLSRWDNIDKILASPLRRFILSLDGLSKETFELIREKAKWEEVYPAVEELCRRRIANGQKYPAITAQFSVMKQNAHEVDAYRA